MMIIQIIIRLEYDDIIRNKFCIPLKQVNLSFRAFHALKFIINIHQKNFSCENIRTVASPLLQVRS